MGKSRLPPKKDVALALLESSTVYVHLDPRVQDVAVPPWFKKQPQLVLQIGLNMPVPIPDLSLDGDGVSCTLSFNRSPQFCSVPWKAVYALVGEDGRGMVWPDDVPPEVAAQTRPATQEPKAKRKKKSHLRAVAEGATKSPKAVPPPAAVSPKAQSKPKDVPVPDPVSDRERELEPSQASEERGATPIPADKAPGSEDTDRDSTPPSKRKLPPYLRVVK